MNRRILTFLTAALSLAASAAEWNIPSAGNAYRPPPETGRPSLDREGSLRWSGPDQRHVFYFRIDRPATLTLALDAAAADKSSRLAAEVAGKRFELDLQGQEFASHPLGEIEIAQAGYVEVVISGISREGSDFGRVRALEASSNTPDLTVDFVKSNQGNMFYWGRRGPSVHLGYPLPEGRTIEYAYSEITVPEGGDPIGSYFMANGFGQGYFGIQVKSPTERWVLFSVWSPFQTDNPREIPEDQRVVTLARGKGVVARDFGGEGSGGQSFLREPWKTGTTYRFLTQVRPDGEGRTVYTGWFGEKGGEWRLIASFRRPQTDTWLTGFHSFLENFAPDFGALGRKSFHENPWVRDREGQWHEITRARFTADATARGRHRMDYAGGVEDGRFFMQNGGFFDQPTRIGNQFERRPTPADQPQIDFDRLPRG